MAPRLKIYKIEILKTEDGNNLEVYVNGIREDSFIEAQLLAMGYRERALNRLR